MVTCKKLHHRQDPFTEINKLTSYKISDFPKQKETDIYRHKYESPLAYTALLATIGDIARLCSSTAFQTHPKHLNFHGVHTHTHTNIANYSYAHCIILHIRNLGNALLKQNLHNTYTSGPLPLRIGHTWVTYLGIW